MTDLGRAGRFAAGAAMWAVICGLLVDAVCTELERKWGLR